MRSAGNTRRLYTDGVLHSAWHPHNPSTGSIWDLLFMPTLFFPLHRFQRILLLGAGAGSVIHMLNRYLQPERIIAIDYDDVHLTVARKFFDITYKNVELVHADAVAWLQSYQGEHFDLIIEDLFIEEKGLPLRLMHDDVSWLDCMLDLLIENGLLVINHGDIREARFTRMHLPRRRLLRQFSLPLLQNRVLAFPASEKQKVVYERNLKELKLASVMNRFSHRLLNTNL